MSGRRRAPAWWWVTGLLLLGCPCGCRTAPAERPSVLVILVDALRPDHLGSYGYTRPTSPRLDALAARSVRFTRAYSVSSWTKPSIPSLFTSLYPSQHGVFEGNAHARGGRLESDVLPGAAWTMAEAFRTCGYHTGGFVDNAHLRAEFGFDQGFDRYYRRSTTAPELVEQLLGWIDGLSAERPAAPFFAYLHVLDAHWPYEPSPESLRELGGEATHAASDRALLDAVNDGQRTLSRQELGRLILSYDAEIRDVDAALGELLARLEERGLLDDMAVVLTADHGEEFLEHAHLGHGSNLYEETTRIPLLLRLPHDAAAGRSIERRAGLLDVMPTMLDLSGCEFEKDALQGRSLMPLVGKAESGDSGGAFAEVRHGATYREALWDGRWKMIRTTHDPASGAPLALTTGRFDAPAELVGARLEVEGEPVSESSFRADDLEFKWPGDDDDEIKARIDEIDRERERIRLGGFTVDVEDAKLSGLDRERIDLDRLAAGWTVKVDGVAADEPYRLEAEKLRVEEPRSDVRIEGPIRAARALAEGRIELELVGVTVVVTAGRLQDALASFVTERERGDRGAPEVAYELYDLESDPAETRDLAPGDARRLRKLAVELDTLRAAFAGRGLAAVARVELDSATTDELRGLGYLQ